MRHHWATVTCQVAFYLLLWTTYTSADGAEPAMQVAPNGDGFSAVFPPESPGTEPSSQTARAALFARGKDDKSGETSSAFSEEPTPSTSGTQRKFYEAKPPGPYHGSTVHLTLKTGRGGPGRNEIDKWRQHVIREGFQNPLHRNPPPRLRSWPGRMSSSLISHIRSGTQSASGMVLALVGRGAHQPALQDPSFSGGRGSPHSLDHTVLRGSPGLRVVVTVGLYNPEHAAPPVPDSTRLIPPPEPTGCGKDGTPLYQWWFHWNSHANDKSLRTNATKPFQLIPKKGGFFLPLPGSIGSYYEHCGPTEFKGRESGFPPRLLDFPGALGSTWHFAPLEESSSSSSDLTLVGGTCSPPDYLPESELGQRQELLNMIQFMNSYPGLPLVRRAGNLMYDILLMVVGDVPKAMKAVHQGCDGVIAHYLMTLAPHFVQILLRMWHQMLKQSTRRKRDHYSINETEATGWLCNWLAFDVPTFYELEESLPNGLYVDCNSSDDLTPRGEFLGSRVRSLTLGNYTRDQLCGLMSSTYKLSRESGINTVSSIYVDCGASNLASLNEKSSAVDDDDYDDNNDHYHDENDGRDIAPGGPSPKIGSLSSKDDKSLTPNSQGGKPGHDNGCSTISELELGFQLDSKENSASKDSIYVSFGDFNHQLVVKNPWSGFHNWLQLDLKAMFGTKKTITFEDLRQINFWSVRNEDMQDGWGFQGIKLKAKCFGSGITWETDKYQRINEWMHRPNDIAKARVWQGVIEPHDWIDYPHIRSCPIFDKLEFSFFPGPHSDGSGDISYLYFPYWGRHDVRFTGEQGWQSWQTIDLKQVFHEPEVSLQAIHELAIKQYHVGDADNHGWDIPSTSRELGLGKFNNITPQVRYNIWGGHITYSYWNDSVDHLKDWVLLSDCARFDRLEVLLGISGSLMGGTKHSLWVTFDKDRHHSAPEQMITSEGAKDFTYRKSIDLQKMFGTKYVWMQDITWFRIFAKPDGKRPDQWKVTKVFFKGRCADDHSKVYLHDEHDKIEDWFDSSFDPPHKDVTRDVSSHYWRLDSNTEEFVQHHTHDGSEF
ncbi:hypothetical protein XA68_12097 [Ophiocordyceps unilateralis]|uniref:Enterotoxin n=1 Tax=Ophiocordyceps unilateralis TaxID=268505 RepID=A0A2A9PFF2_OPHUN|nr:hypothetical protein XA68_12097 [Ophiocordyceps unilateralis]